MSAEHRLAQLQLTQDYREESDKKGKIFLKRPNLFKQGMAGQLEDMSVKYEALCSEVFLSLGHDSFLKLNIRGNYS